MMQRVRLIFIVALLAGCAAADRGQLADGITTWYGLAQNFSETNPLFTGLSGPEILAVKLMATQAVKLTPPVVCEPGLYFLTGVGYSAALWNVGVVVGSGLAALPLAAGWWIYRHQAWSDDAVATCADPYLHFE